MRKARGQKNADRGYPLLLPIVDDLLTGAALSLLLSPLLGKDVVRGGIPGVVNADEEQEQRRRCNAKQGVAQMGASRECRYNQRCICGEGQQNMKQPVLKLRRVCDLHSHTPSHDDLVHDPIEAHQAPKNCGGADPLPRST